MGGKNAGRLAVSRGNDGREEWHKGLSDSFDVINGLRRKPVLSKSATLAKRLRSVLAVKVNLR